MWDYDSKFIFHGLTPPRVLESLRDIGWFQWWGKRVFGGNRELFRIKNIILSPNNHGMSAVRQCECYRQRRRIVGWISRRRGSNTWCRGQSHGCRSIRHWRCDGKIIQWNHADWRNKRMRGRSRTRCSSRLRSRRRCLYEGKNILIKSDMMREINFTCVKVQTLKACWVREYPRKTQGWDLDWNLFARYGTSQG
jgi:hypothetical protein